MEKKREVHQFASKAELRRVQQFDCQRCKERKAAKVIRINGKAHLLCEGCSES